MWVVYICGLLRCYTVAIGKQFPAFYTTVLLPFSGSSRPIFFDGVTPPKTRIFIIITARTSQSTNVHPHFVFRRNRRSLGAPSTAQTVQRTQHSRNSKAHPTQRKQYSAPNIAQTVQRTQYSAVSAPNIAQTVQRTQHSANSTAHPT